MAHDLDAAFARWRDDYAVQHAAKLAGVRAQVPKDRATDAGFHALWFDDQAWRWQNRARRIGSEADGSLLYFQKLEALALDYAAQWRRLRDELAMEENERKAA